MMKTDLSIENLSISDEFSDLDEEIMIPYQKFIFVNGYAEINRDTFISLIVTLNFSIIKEMQEINELHYLECSNKDFDNLFKSNENGNKLFKSALFELNYNLSDFKYLHQYFPISELLEYFDSLSGFSNYLDKTNIVDHLNKLEEIKSNEKRLSVLDKKITNHLLKLKKVFDIIIFKSEEKKIYEDIIQISKKNKFNSHELHRDDSNTINNILNKLFKCIYSNFSHQFIFYTSDEKNLIIYIIYLIHFYITRKILFKKEKFEIALIEIIDEFKRMMQIFFNYDDIYRVYYKLKDELIFLKLIEDELSMLSEKKYIKFENSEFNSFFNDHIVEINNIVLFFYNKKSDNSFKYLYKDNQNNENFLLHILLRFYHFILIYDENNNFEYLNSIRFIKMSIESCTIFKKELCDFNNFMIFCDFNPNNNDKTFKNLIEISTQIFSSTQYDYLNSTNLNN